MESYQNRNVGDLQIKPSRAKGSRKVFFVSRLLTKMKKSVHKITGLTHEHLKTNAEGLAMAIQEAKANNLQPRIDAGNKAIATYSDSEKGYSESKTYSFMIKDLENKQTRLRSKPKKLLVAASYVYLMMNYYKKNVARKKQKKQEQIIAEFEQLRQTRDAIQLKITSIKTQMDPLQSKLDDAVRRLDEIEGQIWHLRNSHPIITADHLSANNQGNVQGPDLEQAKTM